MAIFDREVANKIKAEHQAAMKARRQEVNDQIKAAIASAESTNNSDTERDARNRAAVATTRGLFTPVGSAAERRIKEAAAQTGPMVRVDNNGMPIPMAIRRNPVTRGRNQAVDDWQSHRRWNNPGMLDTYGNPLDIPAPAEYQAAPYAPQGERQLTPASDRQHAIPNWGYTSDSAGQAIDPKQMTARGAAVRNYGETPRPREYSSFGEFLKTMGIGKGA